MGGKMNRKLNFFFYVNFSFLGLNFEIILIFLKLKEITVRFISGPKKNFLYQNTPACDFSCFHIFKMFCFSNMKELTTITQGCAPGAPQNPAFHMAAADTHSQQSWLVN